mmetsp:Transcript_17119/g.26692  ORF Transcript_17119/g.26692 Transcript_17119/m.26692 type:complete len:363 (+) Transcript_17119:699-1787(+)
MRTRFTARRAIVDHFAIFFNFFFRQICHGKHQFPVPQSLLVGALALFARRRTVHFRRLQIFLENADHVAPHGVTRNGTATRHLGPLHIIRVGVAHNAVRGIGSLQQIFILLKPKPTLAKQIAIITVILQLLLAMQTKLFVIVNFAASADAISDVHLAERRVNAIIRQQFIVVQRLSIVVQRHFFLFRLARRPLAPRILVRVNLVALLDEIELLEIRHRHRRTHLLDRARLTLRSAQVQRKHGLSIAMPRSWLTLVTAIVKVVVDRALLVRLNALCKRLGVFLVDAGEQEHNIIRFGILNIFTRHTRVILCLVSVHCHNQLLFHTCVKVLLLWQRLNPLFDHIARPLLHCVIFETHFDLCEVV